jgi:hypothetical protein
MAGECGQLQLGKEPTPQLPARKSDITRDRTHQPMIRNLSDRECQCVSLRQHLGGYRATVKIIVRFGNQYSCHLSPLCLSQTVRLLKTRKMGAHSPAHQAQDQCSNHIISRLKPDSDSANNIKHTGQKQCADTVGQAFISFCLGPNILQRWTQMNEEKLTLQSRSRCG